jgi:DNA repair protein RecN (Recombination protein N)
MLTHLTIQGLAIIESLSIDFSSGFNVITGETGAGKSILIKALSMLLGGKTNADSVRQGFDQASVSGRFLIRSQHSGLEFLKNIGVTAEKDGDHFAVVVRRIVTSKGRSSAWINDVPVTTGTLKELASSLIDVFGQHDSHRLLDSQHHVTCLDQFVEPRTLPAKYHDAYVEASLALKELRDFVHEATGKGKDLDYLAFRLQELCEFKASQEDFTALSQLSLRARSAANISNALSRAQVLLDDEQSGSVSRRLREISKLLTQTKDDSFDGLIESASRAASDIEELSFAIGKALDRLEISEEDIDKAESRLAGYQSLFRKHQVTSIDELINLEDKLKTQVAALEDAGNHVMKLLSALQHKVTTAQKCAALLSTSRRKAAGVVTTRVENELSDLSMPSAKFSVEFFEIMKSIGDLDLACFGDEAVSLWSEILEALTGLNDHGAESAEFYLAANKGEAKLPLAKVASGGEVSRIMLALKKAIVVGAETCVLVFDEIDTGISGRIADIVGQKIAELSKFCQIICISHLPQVAAYAQRHYIVRKTEKGQRTESSILLLSNKERMEEVARMLSGDKITKASLAHAESLVSDAKKRYSKSSEAHP